MIGEELSLALSSLFMQRRLMGNETYNNDGPIRDNKIRHMTAVANYMYEHAKDYGLNPEQMYTLGLLHDIGYLHGSVGHSSYGADMLSRMHLDDRFTYAIANHGEDLSLMFVVSPELKLLVEADLQIDSDGNFIGFEERLNQIRERYGDTSTQYIKTKSSMCYLLGRRWGEYIDTKNEKKQQ